MAKHPRCGCCGRRRPGKKCEHCRGIQIRRRDNLRRTEESKLKKRRQAAMDMAFLPAHKKRELWGPYQQRQALLDQLGFESYAAYLQSGLWKSIRYRVLGMGAKCVRCDLRATEVHHSEYTLENLSGKSLKGLHPACRGCHRGSELRPSGAKRSLRETNEALEIGLEERLLEAAFRPSEAAT